MNMLSLSPQRGYAMKAVGMADVVVFARKWVEAGPHIVQHWASWETQASVFFGVEEDAVGELMHGVMMVASCVCFGEPEVVKASVREATPRVLETCSELFGHLPQFSVILDAERRFRARQLSADWTLEPTSDGKCVVRSLYRPNRDETEH